MTLPLRFAAAVALVSLVHQEKAIFGYDILAPGYEAKFFTKEASA